MSRVSGDARLGGGADVVFRLHAGAGVVYHGDGAVGGYVAAQAPASRREVHCDLSGLTLARM